MTASQQDLSPDQLSAAEKIIKLLNLAAKAGTPAEAATATAKAQEMLEKHNLDASALEALNGAKDGRRTENLVEGGFYAFHRDLWGQVAQLNFCVYWNQKYLSDEIWKGKRVEKRRHALVGRIVNVRMTVAMATYLQEAVERLVREQISPNERLSNWAHSFRKGAIETICNKLRSRRLEVLETERRAAQEAALKAGYESYSIGRGLALAAFSKSEEEANQDFIHGEGYSAKEAQKKAAHAAEMARMDAAYTIWAKENPKKAYRQFKYKDPETGRNWQYGIDRSRGGLGSRGGSDGIDRGAFRAGREAGENVGLDPQTQAAKPAGMLK